MNRVAKDMAALAERDPGFRCSYCSAPLALPFQQIGASPDAWEPVGWDLTLLPDGEPVWQLQDGAALAHRDHVTPRSAGGDDDLGNLVLACESCNMGKAATPLLLFRGCVT